MIDKIKILPIISLLLLSGCATSQALIAQRQQVIAHHPDWAEDKKKEVMDGTLYLGMTKEEVIAIRGYLGSCNKTVTGFGVHEQCVVGDTYFYYDDGVLTSFQELS